MPRVQRNQLRNPTYERQNTVSVIFGIGIQTPATFDSKGDLFTQLSSQAWDSSRRQKVGAVLYRIFMEFIIINVIQKLPQVGQFTLATPQPTIAHYVYASLPIKVCVEVFWFYPKRRKATQLEPLKRRAKPNFWVHQGARFCLHDVEEMSSNKEPVMPETNISRPIYRIFMEWCWDNEPTWVASAAKEYIYG